MRVALVKGKLIDSMTLSTMKECHKSREPLKWRGVQRKERKRRKEKAAIIYGRIYVFLTCGQ